MLSVIIPIYNGKRYLDGIVEAFSIQELPEAELVFVDDGSTDGSYEAMQQLTPTPFLHVVAVRQENRGVSAARNRGVAAASGDWIAFMDADDRVAPDFGVVAKRLMCREDADVFLYRHRAVEDWEKASRTDVVPLVFEPAAPDELVRSLMRTPTSFGVYDLLIRREFLRQSGVRFAEGYPYYEDYEFLYRLFLAGGRVWRTEHALYDYHANHASTMSEFSDERVRCLELYDRLLPEVRRVLPDVAEEFASWAKARIYWSVLWQACVVKQHSAALRQFAAETGASAFMAVLKDFPEKKVSWSARLYGVSPWVYRLLVRVAAGRRQKQRLYEKQLPDEN